MARLNVLDPRQDSDFRKIDSELRSAEKAVQSAAELGRQIRDGGRSAQPGEVREAMRANERLRDVRLSWSEQLREARGRARQALLASEGYSDMVREALEDMVAAIGAGVLRLEALRRERAEAGVRVDSLPPGKQNEIAELVKYAQEQKRLGVVAELPPLLKALTPEEVSS